MKAEEEILEKYPSGSKIKFKQDMHIVIWIKYDGSYLAYRQQKVTKDKEHEVNISHEDGAIKIQFLHYPFENREFAFFYEGIGLPDHENIATIQLI